jgi:GNAT superfamily N-acetyltransferase
MTMSLEIREVRTAGEMKKFVKFALKLYDGNPYHVPALTFDEINTFDAKKNPAFDFCEEIRFLAYREGKIVGRIAGFINHNANKWWKVQNVRFGWFDVVDDVEVSKALLDAVSVWGKKKGMNALTGPMGFTDMDHAGMLVEGYDLIGTFATLYNYPYYPKHMEALGLTKDVDWKEFHIPMPEALPERYTRMANIVAQKYGLRTVKFTSLKQLVKCYGEKIFKLWNDTYNVLYGFSPLTDRQVTYYIKMYLSFVRPDLISIIVDQNDDVVGMGITLPSLSKAFQKANGKIFPFGFIPLMKALKKNDVVDLYLMGIHPDYQGKGVNAMIFADLVPIFIKNGYRFAETNPELELNSKVQLLWSDFNPQHVRTRRVFKKELK